MSERLGAATAARILGVPRGADADTVNHAFRRALTGVHPDRGGDAERTRQLLAAREVLLDDAVGPQAAGDGADRVRTFVRRRRFAWWRAALAATPAIRKVR